MSREMAAHLIFAGNLEQLLKGAESRSAFCKAVGINRSQLARYLSGQTWPKPNVVREICRYFDVDSRVLLEPIDRGNEPFYSLFSNLKVDLPTAHYRVSQTTLPDGFYLCWREAFSQKDKVFCQLVRIYEKGGTRCWRTFRPKFSSGTLKVHSAQDREVIGNIVAQGDSLCALVIDLNRAYLSMYSFRPHIYSSRFTFKGIGVNALQMTAGQFQQQIYHQVLEYVPSRTQNILEAARRQGFYSKSQADLVHPLLRDEIWQSQSS